MDKQVKAEAVIVPSVRALEALSLLFQDGRQGREAAVLGGILPPHRGAQRALSPSYRGIQVEEDKMKTLNRDKTALESLRRALKEVL